MKAVLSPKLKKKKQLCSCHSASVYKPMTLQTYYWNHFKLIIVIIPLRQEKTVLFSGPTVITYPLKKKNKNKEV